MRCWLAAIFASASLFGEKTAHLQYQPDLPVHLTSTVVIDLTQALPGLSLSTKGTEKIEATLSISQERTGLPVSRPPFDLTVMLKSAVFDLQANGEKLSFDTADRGASLYLSQLSKLINRPITLHFGEQVELSGSNDDLKKTVAEFPVLQEIDLENLLTELFFPLFAIAGQKLVEGQEIEKDLSGRKIPSLPQKVHYTITAIDDYHIFAEIKGEVEKQRFQLRGKVPLENQTVEGVSASLSGTMQGKIKWNRDNAMLYEMQVEYAYAARLQLAEWEWLMNVSLKVYNQTQLRD